MTTLITAAKETTIDRVFEQEQSTIVSVLFCHPTDLSLNLISC